MLTIKLGEIYKSKTNENIIQIDSFATRMNSHKDMFVVFNNIGESGGGIGFAPAFNGYGTQEEIEAEYELLVPQKDLRKYESWEEIMQLAKKA